MYKKVFLLGFVFSFTITFYKENVKRHEKSCKLESGSRGRPLIRPLKNNFETETEEKYVHLQLRLFSCSYCKKKFKRNSHAKRHEEKACQMRLKSGENIEIKPA